jgi:hypothetical protein
MAVLGLINWSSYRRLKFDHRPFDARINQRMKLLRRVGVAMLFAGVLLMALGVQLNQQYAGWTLPLLLAGLALEMGAIGVVWNISTVMSELVQRAHGSPEYSKTSLERMTSIRRAFTVNVPVAVLSVLAVVLVLHVLHR